MEAVLGLPVRVQLLLDALGQAAAHAMLPEELPQLGQLVLLTHPANTILMLDTLLKLQELSGS